MVVHPGHKDPSDLRDHKAFQAFRVSRVQSVLRAPSVLQVVQSRYYTDQIRF